MKEKPDLETDSLVLKPACLDDLPDVLRMNSNQDVMRYIRAPRDAATEEAGYREILLKTRETPYGVWTVRDKNEGRFIGWGLIVPLSGHGLVEIGYRLLPEFWGQGFATQIGRAMAAYGFDLCGLDEVVAVTDPDNAASQRVLIKSGLEDRGMIRAYDTDCRYFGVTKADWS